MIDQPDTRTLADLAREVIQVQSACNLSGVVHSFSRSITRLRALLEAEGKGGTQALNGHPICVLWADKIGSLANDAAAANDLNAGSFSAAWAAVETLSKS